MALMYRSVPRALCMVGLMTGQNHQSMAKEVFQKKSKVHFSTIQSYSCIELFLVSGITGKNSFDADNVDWDLFISGVTSWRKCIL
jgi:hypothetical protein